MTRSIILCLEVKMNLGSLVSKCARPEYPNRVLSQDLECQALKWKMADSDWTESKGAESSKELKTACNESEYNGKMVEPSMREPWLRTDPWSSLVQWTYNGNDFFIILILSLTKLYCFPMFWNLRNQRKYELLRQRFIAYFHITAPILLSTDVAKAANKKTKPKGLDETPWNEP